MKSALPVIEFDGQKRTLPQWARAIGLSVPALQARLDRGWPHHQVFDPLAFREKRSWDGAERKELREFVGVGFSQEEIATGLGRSLPSVNAQIWRIHNADAWREVRS